ncbi:MAG: hypothetical protein V2A62_01045 [Candidatus Woesearchaeota archaeon]
MLEYFNQLLPKVEKRKDILTQEYTLEYPSGNFSYYRFSSADISAKDNVVLIAAGIHGDERCCPYTLNEHFEEIFDYAHSKGIKLVMYPLRNPSGYALNQRFNIENDRGDKEIGNNDCLHYQLEDGRWVDGLEGRNYLKWCWADDPILGLALTTEDRLFLQLLHREPWNQIQAVLDFHQDHLTEGLKPGAYHYSPNKNTEPYATIVSQIQEIVPLITDTLIDGGYKEDEDSAANQFYTDHRGFISRHDGSLDDLAYRLGIPHAISAETSGEISLHLADQVNMIWIKGMIDLVAAESNR